MTIKTHSPCKKLELALDRSYIFCLDPFLSRPISSPAEWRLKLRLKYERISTLDGIVDETDLSVV